MSFNSINLHEGLFLDSMYVHFTPEFSDDLFLFTQTLQAKLSPAVAARTLSLNFNQLQEVIDLLLGYASSNRTAFRLLSRLRDMSAFEPESLLDVVCPVYFTCELNFPEADLQAIRVRCQCVHTSMCCIHPEVDSPARKITRCWGLVGKSLLASRVRFDPNQIRYYERFPSAFSRFCSKIKRGFLAKFHPT